MFFCLRYDGVMDETSSQIESLKRRALQLLGVAQYNSFSTDEPSRAVDDWYLNVLCEFLGAFHWTWAAEFLQFPPSDSDVRVWYWKREGDYCYAPTSVAVVPSTRPECQLAFCYALAARVAMQVTNDPRSAQMMESQAARYLSIARYKDASEYCLRGDGAKTHFYTEEREGSGYDYR